MAGFLASLSRAVRCYVRRASSRVFTSNWFFCPNMLPRLKCSPELPGTCCRASCSSSMARSDSPAAQRTPGSLYIRYVSSQTRLSRHSIIIPCSPAHKCIGFISHLGRTYLATLLSFPVPRLTSIYDWSCRHRRNTYLTSLPLVSVCRHGRVTRWMSR